MCKLVLIALALFFLAGCTCTCKQYRIENYDGKPEYIFGMEIK